VHRREGEVEEEEEHRPSEEEVEEVLQLKASVVEEVAEPKGHHFRA
jgi:hypothetical protein